MTRTRTVVLSRALLKLKTVRPKARLVEPVLVEPAATRAGAVAAHSAELRRIERDLHDGTQARLVSLSLRIGLAQRAYDRDPQVAHRLLEDAQEQAQEALAELRHIVRGIHPPILTDRGLVGAVRALAASSGLDVTMRVDGLEDRPGSGPRVPAAVEAAAYYVVAETLANAAGHGTRRASVRLARVGARLRVVVRAEGRGGTEEADGPCPLGVRRRVAALAGTVTVTGPTGGPTVIEVELPCVW